MSNQTAARFCQPLALSSCPTKGRLLEREEEIESFLAPLCAFEAWRTLVVIRGKALNVEEQELLSSHKSSFEPWRLGVGDWHRT